MATPGRSSEGRSIEADRIERRDGLNDAPLSFGQRRIWFLDRFAHGDPVFNLRAALRLRGHLDLDALQAALDGLVAHHEALRTRIDEIAGVPRQRVVAAHPVVLTVTDLSASAPGEAEAELPRRYIERARRTFDLSGGPLFAAELFRVDESDHVLLMTMHHIVADGWSLQLLLRDLAAAYGHKRIGERRIRYLDFARWQSEQTECPRWSADLEYWGSRLRGAPALLPLPTDRPRPAARSSAGARTRASLPPELARPMRELARREGCTPFMLLLAAFGALLSRASGEPDVVVGAPIAGRTRVEVEDVVGCFINTLALRLDLSEDPTFRTLLRQVRSTTLAAYGHQELPFEKLVEELRPPRSLSHTPVFQVMIAFQNVPAEPVRLAGLQVERFALDCGTSNFDLSLFVDERDDGFALTAEYSVELFDGETVDRLLGHLEALLRGIVADPEQRISALPLARAETEHYGDFAASSGEGRNAGGEPEAFTSVIERFEAQAERAAQSVAVVFGETQRTYAEVARQAGTIAQDLRRRGVGPERVVGLLLERSADLPAAMLGILKAGGAFLPIDDALPPARQAFMLQDASAHLLLTQRSLAENLPDDNGVEVVWLDDVLRTAAAEPLEPLDSPEDARDEPRTASATEPSVPAIAVTPQQLAYVIYTSGSTGRPKGVQIEHGALANLLASMIREPGVDATDRWLAVTSTSFDIAIAELLAPLLAGARVIVADREAAADGRRLAAELERSGATIMQATPATWRLLLAAGWQGDARLRALCGGEPLPRDLADELLARAGALWNLYGPTETTIWSTAWRVPAGGDRIVVGKPIAGTHVRVVDGRGREVPTGIAGEIWIGGVGVARGYVDRADLEAERFLSGPTGRRYRTGDLGRVRPDGNLEFLRRIDDQVKVRGHRIEPGEIETVLRQHDAVQDAAVTVQQLAPGDDRLVACYVPAAGAVASATTLRAWLRRRLPEYMIPQHLVELDQLPRTPGGKIDRKALPVAVRDAAHRGSFVAPRSDAERLVARIWGEALGIDRVGVHDNFFELGGHSLLSAEVTARIERATGAEVSLRAIMLDSLEQIAAALPSRP